MWHDKLARTKFCFILDNIITIQLNRSTYQNISPFYVIIVLVLCFWMMYVNSTTPLYWMRTCEKPKNYQVEKPVKYTFSGFFTGILFFAGCEIFKPCEHCSLHMFKNLWKKPKRKNLIFLFVFSRATMYEHIINWPFLYITKALTYECYISTGILFLLASHLLKPRAWKTLTSESREMNTTFLQKSRTQPNF